MIRDESGDRRAWLTSGKGAARLGMLSGTEDSPTSSVGFGVEPNHARLALAGSKAAASVAVDEEAPSVEAIAEFKLIVSTPALRERLWANQMAAQQLILQALGADQRDPRPSFRDKVTVAACLAAASTAVLTWVENDGTPELPDLIESAFDTLTHPR